jgi:serine/threonine-protein kinase RsbW
MAKETVSFKLKNDLSELDRLNEYFEGFKSSVGIEERCTHHCKLGMEELFTNICSYGFPDKKEHWIHFTLWKEKEGVVIRVEDDGIPFNPIEMPEPNLGGGVEDREVGGLGIHLIKHFYNEIEYQRVDNKNVIILKIILE